MEMIVGEWLANIQLTSVQYHKFALVFVTHAGDSTGTFLWSHVRRHCFCHAMLNFVASSGQRTT